MNNDPRILKTFDQQFNDLREYTQILRHAIIRFEKGEFAYFKSILATLRILVSDKSKDSEALLFRLLKASNLKSIVTINAWEGVPPAHPRAKATIMSLQEYMRSNIVLDGKSITYKQYIWDIASQHGSHSSERIDPGIALGDSLFFCNLSANELQVMAIARTVCSCSESTVAAIESKIGVKL